LYPMRPVTPFMTTRTVSLGSLPMIKTLTGRNRY